MNYTTEKGFEMLTEDKMEITRMVYALEKRGTSYNIIKECICILEKNIDINDTFITEVEDLSSFVINKIMDFATEHNLPKDKLEHIRVYIDILENPNSMRKIIKSIDIYEDYDKQYMNKELDKLFESMDNIVKPEYVPVIDYKFNIDESKGLKNHNKELMLDIIKQKNDEINNGGIKINKLSALLKLEDKSRDGIRKMINDVMNLNIKPKAVYISEDIVNVMYICNESCIVQNVEEYTSILSDFVSYINNIEKIDLYLDDSILYGDYEVDYYPNDIDVVNFNSENFDSKITLFAGKVESDFIQVIL